MKQEAGLKLDLIRQKLLRGEFHDYLEVQATTLRWIEDLDMNFRGMAVGHVAADIANKFAPDRTQIIGDELRVIVKRNARGYTLDEVARESAKGKQ